MDNKEHIKRLLQTTSYHKKMVEILDIELALTNDDAIRKRIALTRSQHLNQEIVTNAVLNTL